MQELAKHSPDEAFAAYMEEGKKVERLVVEADERLRGVREEINNFTALESAKKERLFALQKEFRGSQHQLNAATCTY
jgi:predicted  nucleic acid-binding Zn-ribbon protein